MYLYQKYSKLHFSIKTYVTYFLIICLGGCSYSNESIKNRAIGAPGELLLVIEKELQSTDVYKTIKSFANKAFPCIPQPESTFKLTTITPNEFEGHFKAYRNIIIIKRKHVAEPIVRCNKNVWATFQQVVEFELEEFDLFSTFFKENEDLLQNFLYYGDINSMKHANLKGSNVSTKRFIKDKHGIEIVLPNNFLLVKDTTDFSWFRYDKLETSMHVVIHSFDLNNEDYLNSNDLIAFRDSLGKKFIPGPYKNTYMQTEKELPVQINKLAVNNSDVVEIKGLWKVEGYFMGGPFVNFVIFNESKNKLLMVDGFIHAPEKQNKAYYVRQMESILHSIEI